MTTLPPNKDILPIPVSAIALNPNLHTKPELLILPSIRTLSLPCAAALGMLLYPQRHFISGHPRFTIRYHVQQRDHGE